MAGGHPAEGPVRQHLHLRGRAHRQQPPRHRHTLRQQVQVIECEYDDRYLVVFYIKQHLHV